MITRKAEQTERLRRNEEKWSTVLMNAGWTVIPSILLEKQAALGLDAIDVNILLHLAKHSWYRENPPHPSKLSIAKAMGIDPSTVRKRIARMQSEGVIQREYRYKRLGGQETNFYHFDGLIKALTPHAEEFITMRENREQRTTLASGGKGRSPLWSWIIQWPSRRRRDRSGGCPRRSNRENSVCPPWLQQCSYHSAPR